MNASSNCTLLNLGAWVKSSESLLVMDEQLVDPAGPLIPRPNRSCSGPIFHATGISDHLPVGAVLQR